MGATHTVELITKDGRRLDFDCSEEQTVLEAAADNGIVLASMCRQGGCGVCRGRCTEGRYRLGEHSASALGDEAKAAGEVLLCRTYPRGPLSLTIDQSAGEITAGPVPEREATVAALEDVGGGVTRLLLELEADASGAAGASFEPGQYVRLTPAGAGITRAYSMANTPNWDGLLEFYIRRQLGGAFSGWLERAARGDRLRVEGPEGSFTLDEARLAPRCFIAGGTGLAPMLSMLRWMAQTQAVQPARLYFGVNGQEDLFARAEIDELRASLPGLAVEICLWRPEPEWAGFAGTPVDALGRDLPLSGPNGGGCDIYVCGPPALVEATEALARRHGIGEQVRSERFLPS